LLAAEFEGNSLIEWMDLMQYDSGARATPATIHPFPDYVTAEKTFVSMTARQLDNEENSARGQHPADISSVGNRTIIDMASEPAHGSVRTASCEDQSRSIKLPTARLGSPRFWKMDTSGSTTRRNYNRTAAGINVMENYCCMSWT